MARSNGSGDACRIGRSFLSRGGRKRRRVADEINEGADIEEYKKVLVDLEELEAIRAYDEAKSADDEAIPFGQAVDEIKAKRK